MSKIIKFFEDSNKTKSVDEICEEYGIENYSMNPDGSIDVDGSVDLSGIDFTELPLKFNKVSEHFYCSNNKLTSLEFCPKEVGGNFDCSKNKIINLNGFDCVFNKSFICYNNPISSIFNHVDSDFTYAFQVYKVINGNVINLRRLRYAISTWKIPFYLTPYIKKHYIIN